MIGGPTLVAGLDVGTTKTCAVILEVEAPANGGPPPARVVGTGLAATDGVRNRTVMNLETATESIRTAVRDAEAMARHEVEELFVGIAGDHIEVELSSGVVAVQGQEVAASDVRRVHEAARAVVVPPDREVLHAIPEDYAVDGRNGIQDPVGMPGTRLESEMLIVTAASPACRNLRRAVDRAGYRAGELVLGPLASSHAVLAASERQAGVALLELGGAATDILVVRDERIRLLDSLPFGSMTVTSDIVKGLGLPTVAAERLKREWGVARTQEVDPAEHLEVPGPLPGRARRLSRELLAHVIEQRLDEIFGLVYERMEEGGTLGEIPAGIVLTGAGATLEGTVALAQDVFNAPVRLGSPGDGLGGLSDAVRRPKFAAAVGLARYGLLRQRRGGGAAGRALGRMAGWLKDFF